MFRPAHALLLSTLICSVGLCAQAQESEKDGNKSFDVRSTVGDLHVGADADARKAGLPLYPGARPKHENKDDNAVNLGILTEAFGFKLVVASYETDDAPGKVLDFYRDKLKKYGKVLECHSKKPGDDVNVHDDEDKDSNKSKEL